MAVKTELHSRENKDDQDARHKYVKDEMLPEEEKKLQKIQWKMTNKVANDFVSLLMGWTRDKTFKIVNNVPIPVADLSYDKGFGGKMAKKALGGRGFFGRLKQSLFGGSKANNVISVAFLMADYNDGWTVEEEAPPEAGSATAASASSSGAEVSESTDEDPFYGESFFDDEDIDGIMNDNRQQLVEGVCKGTRSVDDLLMECMLSEQDGGSSN